MRKIFVYILLTSIYGFLYGCGTTGPLYIPEQRYPQEVKSEAPEEIDTKQTPNN